MSEIIHGDALEVLRGMSDESVDAVITDPPYSSGGQFRGDRMNKPSSKYVQSGTQLTRPEFAGDNRDQRSYAFWSTLWLSECLRVTRSGSPICIFTDWRQLPITTDMIQAGGWVWRGIAVWDKTEAARPAYGRFRSQCEYIVWGSKGPMRLNDGSPCLPGVFRHVVKQTDKHHITGKPTDLMRQVVRIARRGAIILDPFAGSGTTGVAAALEGMSSILIEREKYYADVARARLDQTTTPPQLLSSKSGQWVGLWEHAS